MRKTPTSHDVASLAGVSQPTVSRALRDDPRVAEETRLRVREAADALAYVPSRRGRSLSTQATGQVAVVVSDLVNPFYMEAIEHLYAALEALQYRLVVLTAPPGQSPRPERLLDGAIDGAILATTLLGSPLPAHLAARGLPVVQFNRAVDEPVADACVSRDLERSAAVAVELLRLGHRRIGAIFGPADTSTARDREQGFRAELVRAGAPLEDTLVRRGPYAHRTGVDGLTALVEGARPPTAIYCGNDIIAMGVLSSAVERGLAVPRDLTVFGHDDIAMAAWSVFRLSSVRQDLAAMARVATRMLVERIAQPELPPRREEIATQMVFRSSHGPPRAPGPAPRRAR